MNGQREKLGGFHFYSETIIHELFPISLTLFCYRHTSDLENFNSLILKYAPKRVAFTFQYYRDRMFLAALDHNFQLFRAMGKSFDGERLHKRVYCKRVKYWHADPVRVPKTYPYIRFLICRIMIRRKHDMEIVNRAFIKPKGDPKLTSPSIGGVPPEKALKKALKIIEVIVKLF